MVASALVFSTWSVDEFFRTIESILTFGNLPD